MTSLDRSGAAGTICVFHVHNSTFGDFATLKGFYLTLNLTLLHSNLSVRKYHNRTVACVSLRANTAQRRICLIFYELTDAVEMTHLRMTYAWEMFRD